MVDRYTQAWGGRGKVDAVTSDRILVGGCAAVWLALVGMSVAALVALMDLGRGFHAAKGNPHTSSVLYAIIVISALVILAAIPMLLRARRISREAPVARPASRTVSARSIRSGPMAGVNHGATERLTTQRPALADAELDRFWLRGTASLMAAMGGALLAVATATYAMAIGHDAFSWTGYAIAGVVTLAMPLVPWRQVRHLRDLLG
ncbi:DUF2561 family protein [Candidatus Mycobacterium wuenschmannii]|uniref:DUF2561 family protein n=1 Tax=Candidatus Mycobacterium wuenschmannii TaxID=3027808 RepID=A0ABY8W466_9MYCO|nr:DUF2561 family protein [Candidatus Mycobacterium wuenschmannii]WIM89213.1 DUF2561 family protein [Candidatus Mycobacterium wuenschmannii]